MEEVKLKSASLGKLMHVFEYRPHVRCFELYREPDGEDADSVP